MLGHSAGPLRVYKHACLTLPAHAALRLLLAPHGPRPDLIVWTGFLFVDLVGRDSGPEHLSGLFIRSGSLLLCLTLPSCISLWVIKNVTFGLGERVTTGLLRASRTGRF